MSNRSHNRKISFNLLLKSSLFLVQVAVLLFSKNLHLVTGDYTDPKWVCPNNETYTEYFSDRGFVVECKSVDDRCDSFILVPAENLWSDGLRGFLYFLALMYFFLGIAIVSDTFMSAIEVITSETRESFQDEDGKDGRTVRVSYKVWNPTVANLTLMALGSSAPEIMLATIETVSTLDSEPGELGPSTIVGSAAYNLLVITGVCILSIPDGSVKRIEQYGVFAITASASLIAYLWMYIVLSVISPDEIELWEAGITLLAFPTLVFFAYVQDIRGTSSHSKQEELQELKETIVALELVSGKNEISGNRKKIKKEVADIRKQWKESYKRDPTTDEMLRELQARVLPQHDHQHHSTAVYRANAIRGLTGKRRVLPTKPSAHPSAKHQIQLGLNIDEFENPHGVLAFQIMKYEVLENVGQVVLTVLRLSGSQGKISVDYHTEDGSALSVEDYVEAKGTIVLEDGQESETITITIIDDDQFEPDENFWVVLENPSGGATLSPSRSRAEVIILNDDNPGVLGFRPTEYKISEDAESVEIFVHRSDGCDGEVSVAYSTQPGTAKPYVEGQGGDYEHQEGILKFGHNEVSRSIEIKIYSDQVVEGDHFFKVLLRDPQGGAIVANRLATVTINDSTKTDQIFQKLKGVLKTKATGLSLATSSWREQFEQAIEMGGDIDEDGNKLEPETMDYVMHSLTFFWKIIFSFIPPTCYYGGWATFIVSLMFIGICTAIVGEIATIFGCAIGLKDSVTAITFVALGTSLPDTFASKQAAMSDDSADNSVGNVTGSNSVNVYLGLGLPWVIGAGYNTIQGTTYSVPAGPLAFSVAVFLAVAIACLLVLSLKRTEAFGGGELGGTGIVRTGSAVFFFFLWFLYILLSSLQAYDHI